MTPSARDWIVGQVDLLNRLKQILSIVRQTSKNLAFEDALTMLK